jgi:hypothetical protein
LLIRPKNKIEALKEHVINSPPLRRTAMHLKLGTGLLEASPNDKLLRSYTNKDRLTGWSPPTAQRKTVLSSHVPVILHLIDTKQRLAVKAQLLPGLLTLQSAYHVVW